MIKSYRFFDYSGTALAKPYIYSDISDLKQIFKEDRNIKRVEVYERKENQSIFEETYLLTYHAKDFQK